MELPFRLVPPFIHDQGFCWRARLPAELGWAMDSSKRPRVSPLCLWEDDRRMAPGHSLHAEIGAQGQGRHSFWVSTLYFSASDNSDPNSNGRSYSVDLGEPGRAADRESSLVRRPATPLPAPGLARPLRLGMVGAGQRGRSIATQLAQLPDAVIGAVYDPLQHRTKRFIAAYGKTAPIQAAASFDALVADPTLDALVIASPDHQHEAQALQALAAGRPLFLEKPVAIRPEGADAILAMARRTGLPVHVGFVLRYSPFYEAVRDEIRSAGLGEIIALDLADHLSVKHGASYRRRWHRRSEWSGGLMLHKGSHDIDLAEWLLGQRIVKVASTGGAGPFGHRPAPATHCSLCPERAGCRHCFEPYMTYVAEEEADDLTAHDIDRCVFGLDQDIVEMQTVLMEMADGSRASLRIDMFNPGESERRLRLLAERGTIEGRLNEGSFRVSFNDGRPPYDVAVSPAGGHGGGDSRSLLRFLQSLASGSASDNALQDACRGVHIAAAADLSLRSGRQVEIA